MYHHAHAFLIGLSDGWREPYELSSGMTYDDLNRQDWYDRGVNLGQRVRSPRYWQYSRRRLLELLSRTP